MLYDYRGKPVQSVGASTFASLAPLTWFFDDCRSGMYAQKIDDTSARFDDGLVGGWSPTDPVVLIPTRTPGI